MLHLFIFIVLFLGRSWRVAEVLKLNTSDVETFLRQWPNLGYMRKEMVWLTCSMELPCGNMNMEASVCRIFFFDNKCLWQIWWPMLQPIQIWWALCAVRHLAAYKFGFSILNYGSNLIFWISQNWAFKIRQKLKQTGPEKFQRDSDISYLFAAIVIRWYQCLWSFVVME